MKNIDPQDPISVLMTEDPFSVEPDTSLRHVCAMLSKNNIGAVLVDGEKESAQGIVSERDIVTALYEGADPDEVWASDVMTVVPITTPHYSPIIEVGEKLVGFGIRHVIIERDDQTVGIVSARDVLAVLSGHLFEVYYKSLSVLDS